MSSPESHGAHHVFHPKILACLGDYSLSAFGRDLVAGIIVGLVALPLSIAFGIASGCTPEQGIITAIVAGFIISALGGSRVQIGGPTGAFVVVVYAIIAEHGYDGLAVATMMAGVIIIGMALLRMGSLIKFIPLPLVVGFTSGIAVVIFSGQVKDFLGLRMAAVPAGFAAKWVAYWENLDTVNPWALLVAALTVGTILLVRRLTPRIPGASVALVLTTLLAALADLPVETIGGRFGAISAAIPVPRLPNIDWSSLGTLLSPALTIAVLGAVESLLSAVVADGMIGGKHRSNTELMAQGIANLASPLFGGIPATGAIARTVTNIRNGGRTPVAGVVHALTLAVIVLFAGGLAAKIPMATLAGILVVVAYNMSEWREFKSLLRAPRPDVVVLVATFAITVLVDLSVAIQVGMVMSALLFMHRMAEASDIKILERELDEDEDEDAADNYYYRPGSLRNVPIPGKTRIFELHGALFFGAAAKFEELLRESSARAEWIVLRMENVYHLDASGIKILAKFAADVKSGGARLLVAEARPNCLVAMRRYGLAAVIGGENIVASLEDALRLVGGEAEKPSNKGEA